MLNYQVVQRPRTAGIDQSQIRMLTQTFRSLDILASEFDGQSDVVMETINVAADMIRGVVDAVHGVDVCPVSDIGAHENVDLNHSLGVARRLIHEATQMAVSTAAPMERSDWRVTPPANAQSAPLDLRLSPVTTG